MLDTDAINVLVELKRFEDGRNVKAYTFLMMYVNEFSYLCVAVEGVMEVVDIVIICCSCCYSVVSNTDGNAPNIIALYFSLSSMSKRTPSVN